MRGRGRGSRTRRGWAQPRDDNMQVSVVSPMMAEEVGMHSIQKMIINLFRLIHWALISLLTLGQHIT